jgi:hypothetical protein
MFCMMSAPGRIRTCDRRIRSPLLYPLSYERARSGYPTCRPYGFHDLGSAWRGDRLSSVDPVPAVRAAAVLTVTVM